MQIINSSHLERPSADLHYKDVRKCLYNDLQKVSVIVQAYGRLEKTKNCVESILKYTDMKYELVLMDNGTLEEDLTKYFESVNHPNKKIIRLTKNITGVYATDRALHQIEATYVVIVNNDIIVTPHWLENLIICADSDDSIGMIVPVSTNVSNYQQETLGGFESIDIMQKKAADFNVSDPLKWEERIRLIPTATLYRREIFDLAGYYDLGFMHDFGDDDFTFRVRRAGYKLMVCRDTFVHHDHNQTALPPERLAIGQQSKEFFKEKYYGIDAWSDTGNYINFAFGSIRFDNNGGKSIMALDVKCGTPILDAKNFFRKSNIPVSVCRAYTTDAKYMIDLQSISDEVVCGNIEKTIKQDDEKYDLIILGNPVNSYNKPIELLKSLIKRRKENGYLIFPVRNTNDVRSMLNILNIPVDEDELCPRKMNYRDILNKIADFGIKNADVTYTLHNLDDGLKSSIANLVVSMNIDSDKNEIMQNLLIEDYWITVN